MTLKKILMYALALGNLLHSVEAMDSKKLSINSSEFTPGLKATSRTFVPGQGMMVAPPPPLSQLAYYRPSSQTLPLSLSQEEYFSLGASIQRGLKDTKHNLFACHRDLSYCLDVINILTRGNFLDTVQLDVAYAIATHLRHEQDFVKPAETIFNIIISSPLCSNSLASHCYRGLAKIESRSANASLTKIVDLMDKAIKRDPTIANNYLWLGNVPRLAPEMKINCLVKAEEIMDINRDPLIQAKILIKIGTLKPKNADYKDLSNYFFKALNILGENGNRDLIARAYMGLASSDDSNELLHFLKALEILGNDGKPNLIALIYNSLGTMGYINSDHQTQVSWHLDALEILGKNGKPYIIAQSYIALGNAKYPDGRKNKIHYLKALEILGKNGHPDVLAQIYNGLGYSQYTDKTHPDQASWHLHALETLGDDGIIETIAQSYIGLGHARFSCRNLHINGQIFDIYTSEEWFEMALEILENSKDRVLKAHAYNGLGNAAGDSLLNEEAIQWFRKALEMTPWDEHIKDKIARCQGILKKIKKPVPQQKNNAVKAQPKKIQGTKSQSIKPSPKK